MAKVNFTAGRIAEFKCPDGKSQAFLWDAKAPGLALRVTANDARAYVFQGRLSGQTIRHTIGAPDVWSISKAQDEARRLQGLLDQGRDPRIEKAATVEKEAGERVAKRAARRRLEVSGLDAWSVYCADRKSQWAPRSYADHLSFSKAAGKSKRTPHSPTNPGPLYALLSMPLAAIDGEAVCAWVVREVRHRRTTAQHGFRLLRAFLGWCGQQADYKDIVCADACKHKKARERLGKPAAKSDSLQREQLEAWFAEVRKDPNPVAAAYSQVLLLTGARLTEILSLRWEDVDFQWKTLHIRDKVEQAAGRTIPLTPYVAHLLSWLPRRNAWVFSSPTAKGGVMMEPRVSHNKAVQAAGLPHLTFHGLRRSFGTISEWVECPVGVVAQIQGHKPSALAEKHYRVRPIDLLRMWHERIEAFMLENAKVTFKPKEEKLRVAAAA